MSRCKRVSWCKQMSRCKRVSWCKQMSRSPMGLLNGHADPTPKDLPEPISLCNPMDRCPSSQHLLARCFGAIGSAVSSGDTGSLCCAHKPFCSPLAQFSTCQERLFPYRMCLPVPNEPIGGSVGSNVSLAMLASLPPHHLRSLFMV